jgi:hypothetical protein
MKAKAEVAAGVVGDLDKSLAAARKEFAATGFRGAPRPRPVFWLSGAEG